MEPFHLSKMLTLKVGFCIMGARRKVSILFMMWFFNFIYLLCSCSQSTLDSEFSFWCGGYAKEGVATLVCFTINCFHSSTSYTWVHNDVKLVADIYAVLYTDSNGIFKCVMRSGGREKTQEFTVVGEESSPKKRCMCVYWIYRGEFRHESKNEGAQLLIRW